MRIIGWLWFWGALLGCVLGWTKFGERFALTRGVRKPLPHQIPKYEGGISLRFAMVHDVVHERFARHGAAYYAHRNAVVKSQLDALDSPAPATRPSEAAWRLMDDLAVGHVHLGEYAPAIEVMRAKLARQEKLGITGPALYPTYANLGTAMMIDALVKANAGQDATAELRESLTWVRKSIEVDPQAHFGREAWQVALGEFLLDAAVKPELLATFDMIGNRLDGSPDYYGYHPRFVSNGRKGIPEVGAEREWSDRTHTSCTQPVAFDEPVLGIVGMWRYGGGANVHFALALADTMFRVGQRHIAWAAYERGSRLAAALPDKSIADGIAKRCAERQAPIETWIGEQPSVLRAAFDADLKAGLDYQAAYQKFEADRLAAGASIDDPKFYDAFFAAHGHIESDPQGADELVVSTKHDGIVSAAVIGGAMALLVATNAALKQRVTSAAPT